MKKARLTVIIILCVMVRCALCALIGFWVLMSAISHPPMSEKAMTRRYQIALEAIPALDLESCDIEVAERGEGLRFARRGEKLRAVNSQKARELMGADGQELPPPTAGNIGPYLAYADDIHRCVVACLENDWVVRLAPDETGRYGGVFYADLSGEGLALFLPERDYDRAYVSLYFDGDTFLRYSLHCCEGHSFDTYTFGEIDYLHVPSSSD